MGFLDRRKRRRLIQEGLGICLKKQETANKLVNMIGVGDTYYKRGIPILYGLIDSFKKEEKYICFIYNHRNKGDFQDEYKKLQSVLAEQSEQIKRLEDELIKPGKKQQIATHIQEQWDMIEQLFKQGAEIFGLRFTDAFSNQRIVIK